MMLDDLRHITRRDKQDLLGAAEHQVIQLLDDFDISISGNFTSVMLIGMGGSAVGGEMVKIWPGVTIPFDIIRGYDLPSYAGEGCLVIFSSYSGNTEETLSALKQAQETQATIAVITAGGELQKQAEEHNYVLAKLGGSSVRSPRMASLQGFAALVAVLSAAKLTSKPTDELESAVEHIRSESQNWRPDTATSSNLAKQTALEVMGSSVILYAGPQLESVAKRWKIALNENAKNLAWTNSYPEYNHNEFTSWSGHPLEKRFSVVNLRSSFEGDRIQKRFEVSNQLLSGKQAFPVSVEAQGSSVLEQLLWSAVLGDFVSLYLAILNNVDPAALPLVDKLKEKL